MRLNCFLNLEEHIYLYEPWISFGIILLGFTKKRNKIPNNIHTPAVVKNMGGLVSFSENPNRGGPIATPKKRTVPYKQVIIPRSVLGAEDVINVFNEGNTAPVPKPRIEADMVNQITFLQGQKRIKPVARAPF